MLSRAVRLRPIVAARPLALAQWRRAALARPLSAATALLARRGDISSDKLYTPEQINQLIQSTSSKPLSRPNHESATDVVDQGHTQAPCQEENQDEPRDPIDAESSKLTAGDRAGMPDIENYEPTDAELEEILASAHTTLGDEGLSTEEAAAADLDAQYNSEAHGEYDTLASEDDMLFETSPNESHPRSRPFNHELLTHQHLGVSALGRPVEALILKDPNRMQRSKRQFPVFEPETPDVEPSVELKWTDYVAKPGDEQDPVLEAWDNIDEMRPTDTKTIPAHEYHRLVAALVEGFTQGQLASYITMKHAQELEAKATEESEAYPWIQKQTPWQAAYQSELESKKPKYICSAAIIDKIWKLEVREQVESLGRALLWIHPMTFRLLTGHGRPVLEAIQREMLNPGNNERLAAKSEESRIGIYASKAAIPPIIARLNKVAQTVVSAQLSTEYIKKENLSQPILDNLASITKTVIEKSRSGNDLLIYWIADSDRPKPLSTREETGIVPEGPADVVWRLLMAAQTIHEAEAGLLSKMITRSGRGKKLKGAVYMDYHREARSKSWRDKLRSWTRYVDAVAKPDDKKLQPLQLASRVELAQLPPASLADGATASELTIATFGHVLHPADTTTGSSKKNADKSRRILSPVIPHPAALTTLSAGDEPVTQSTAIILNFSPDTTQQDGTAAANGQLHPRVRLTLPVDETTDLSNFDFPPHSTLHAITTQRIQDLLLPTESVDVRLTQQQLVSLATEQPALKQFLSASEFNLLEGRLRTPSRIAFALRGGDTETTDVPYLFMGLEVHQAVETSLAGHTFRYESIEAGQHGGQRQQLSLHRASSVSGSKDDGFMQLVEDVAAGNVFSWNDGAALMQQRSSETFTMDMLEDDAVEEEQLLEEDEVSPLQEHDDVPREEGVVSGDPREQEQGDSREDVASDSELAAMQETPDAQEDCSPKEFTKDEPEATASDSELAAMQETPDAQEDCSPKEFTKDEPEATAADSELAATQGTSDAHENSPLEELTKDECDSAAASHQAEEPASGEEPPTSSTGDGSSDDKQL